MEDYKSNSHRSRENSQESPPEKRVEKVVTTPVKSKKKGEIQKFAGLFVPEDITSVKSYVLFDVVVPLIKKALSDTVDAILYPGEDRSKKRTPAARVAYGNQYEREADRRNYAAARTRNGYSYDDYIIGTRGEAEEVLSRMDDLMETYGLVSVADFYDMVGVTGNYTDNKYGWTDIRSAQVMRVREGGYMIKLPKALPLN